MRYQDYLIEQYFESLKLSDNQHYYTTLLNIAYAIVEADKDVNRAIVKNLNYIRDNTSDILLIPLSKAETLYFKKYNPSKKRIIEYTTKTGMPKRISLSKLKYEMSNSIIKITRLFSKIAKNYNLQRKRMDVDSE